MAEAEWRDVALKRARLVASYYEDPLPTEPDIVSIALAALEVDDNFLLIEAIGNAARRRQAMDRGAGTSTAAPKRRRTVPDHRTALCPEVHPSYNVSCRRRKNHSKGLPHKFWNSSTGEIIEWRSRT